MSYQQVCMDSDYDRMVIERDYHPPHFCKALMIQSSWLGILSTTKLQFGKAQHAFNLTFKTHLNPADCFISDTGINPWTRLCVHKLEDGGRTLIDVFVKTDELANEYGLDANTVTAWSESSLLQEKFHRIKSQARLINELFPFAERKDLRRICGRIEENRQKWEGQLITQEDEILKIPKEAPYNFSVYMARKGRSKKLKCYIHMGKKTEIGSGSYKTITQIFDYDTLKIWVLAKSILSADNSDILQNEARCLKMFPGCNSLIQSPHIANSSSTQYIILPYCELGDLLDYYNCLHARDTKQIALNIMEAVLELHKNDIAHQDIKPENVLLYRKTTRGLTKIRCKLGDFGFTRPISEISSLPVRGTLWYCSPEKILASAKGVALGSENALPSDVWSLGYLLNIIFYNDQLYFNDSNFEARFIQLINLNPALLISEIESYIEKEFAEPSNKSSLKHLIWEMLRPDPRERITVKAAYPRLRKLFLN